MSDQCMYCVKRGNLTGCQATDCNQHESWYAGRLRATLDRIAAWNIHVKPGHVDYKSRADVVAMAKSALYPAQEVSSHE
uniref:Uncharacterized protein n=1 Tax=viral metagenome TaxID=1070528 RepID=A0A6H2A540_9ZZZZ